MDAPTADQTTRQLFDLMVDADRLRMAGRLIDQAWTVSELARELNLKPQAVVTHLSRFDDTGLLVIAEADGQQRYRFNVPALHSLNKRVRESEPQPAPPELENADADDRKILAGFFTGQRLKSIPVQRGKRLVVCAWLASQFAPDTDYPEHEINAILQRHHPDFATLRRQLVDDGFLSRDHGIYRRVASPICLDPAASDSGE